METRQRAGLTSPTVPTSHPKRAKPKATKVRRRYPLHAVFLIYCLVSLLVAVGAFNANNNLLFWLFGLSLGMLLVSGVISGSMMMSLTVRRDSVEQSRVGEPLRIRYTITNRSRWLPVIGLTLTERVVASTQTDEHAATLAAPPTGSVPHVPARSTIVVETLARPTARGRLTLSGFDVLTTFPFGIIRKSLSHQEPASIIVHPAGAKIPDGLFSNAKGVTGSGAAATRPGRLGDEPVGVREYRPGDPPKLVSWRASARRPNGDLLVRQNAEGSPRRLWVLLKLSAGAPPQQTERALSAAASIIRAATGDGAGKGLRVGLSLRTDWAGPDGREAGFDIAPRIGGASVVLLNDLSLLVVPPMPTRGLNIGGDPRLASSDIVVGISPAGHVDAPSTGATVRRLASHRVGAKGGAA
jgi:uncharacterized protein (DUF58 family)